MKRINHSQSKNILCASTIKRVMILENKGGGEQTRPFSLKGDVKYFSRFEITF